MEVRGAPYTRIRVMRVISSSVPQARGIRVSRGGWTRHMVKYRVWKRMLIEANREEAYKEHTRYYFDASSMTRRDHTGDNTI